MQRNRSIPPSQVTPVLTYPDVRAAVDWLRAAFGVTEHVWIGPNHRAQLMFESGSIIAADATRERAAPVAGAGETHSVMVRVDDARAHCERARAHGAEILQEPTDWEYGERQYSCRDLAGHRWTFSQTLHDAEPESWGGTTVAPYPQDERKLAGRLFNETWRLLDKTDRTPEENTLMIHCAHASRFHWQAIGNASNHAIGEWQISRVYSVLGLAEPALRHARLCLEQSLALGPFQKAFAHEAMARALSLNDKAAAKAHHQAATDLIAAIDEPEERKIVQSDLATIDVF
jgi:uncharacterized glyoxalase superfamily protein PhnB